MSPSPTVNDENIRPVTPLDSYGEFRPSLPRNHALTEISGPQDVSSTQASIDSGSDYRDTLTEGSVNGPALAMSSLGLSGNVSRSSSFSLLSTVAQKDGIQGKRVHKFHDPLAYSSWLNETDKYADETSTSPSLRVSGYSAETRRELADEEDQDQDQDLELEAEAEAEEEAETRAQRDLEADIDMSQDGKSLSDYSYSIGGPEGDSAQRGYNSSIGGGSGVGSNFNEPPSKVPNMPNGPPVTLNEKIRLLRTGSVSGSFNQKMAENFLMSDPFTRSEAGSIVSSNDGDDSRSQF